jgi:hypothetical protein
MNAAEYVSVLVSIVIGLALADILTSLHELFRAGRRVKWDWAAPLATALVVMLLMMMWWSLYPGQAGAGSPPAAAEPMTIGRFLPQFVLLVLLFLLAAGALPDEVPVEGVDLRAYYERNAAYFWSLFAATLAWVMGVEIVGAALEGAKLVPLLSANTVEFGILAVFVSLIFVRKRWWLAVAFLILASGPISWVTRSLG